MEVMMVALIAIALSMDTFIVSINKARFIIKRDITRAAYVGLWLCMCQGASYLLGFWGSYKYRNLFGEYTKWVPVAIVAVLFVGTCIASILDFEVELGVYDSLKAGTMLIMGFATAVDAFAVGCASAFKPILILHNTRLRWNILLNAGILTAVTFIAAVIGVRLGYSLKSRHNKQFMVVSAVMYLALCVSLVMVNLGV